MTNTALQCWGKHASVYRHALQRLVMGLQARLTLKGANMYTLAIQAP